MAEQGVEGAAADLAAVDQVEKGLVVLQVSKALIPAVTLDAAQLLALDFGDDLGSAVGELLIRRELTES